MIFSGMATHYGCSRCDFTGSQARSTSLMLYIGLLGMSLAIFIPQAKVAVDLTWYIVLGIILGEVFLLFIAGYVSEWIADRFDRIPATCPKCRASVVSKGTGFYDFSIIPHFTDIFTTILFVAYNLVAFFIFMDIVKH